MKFGIFASKKDKIMTKAEIVNEISLKREQAEKKHFKSWKDSWIALKSHW